MSDTRLQTAPWWRAALSQSESPPSLPLMRTRSKVYAAARAESAPVALPSEAGAAALMAAVAAWFHRCHGPEPLRVGLAEAGRLSVAALQAEETESLSALNARATAAHTDALTVAAPEALAEALAEARANANPLFSVLISDGSALPDLRNDLTLRHAGGQLTVTFSARLIAPESAAHFIGFIARHLAAPEGPLATVPLVSEAERAALLAEGQGEAADYASGRVETLVAAWADKTPDAPALIGKDRSWSYAALMADARAVAGLLDREGIAPGDRVGLAMPPSGDALVALLGILLAGGTVVAIDPDFPEARNAMCLEDAACAAVVTLSTVRGGLPDKTRRIALDRAAPAEPLTGASRGVPGDAVYVIFTSGSTGRPKGVAMPHRALWNLIHWQAGRGAAPQGRRTLHRSSIGFDVGFQEVFATLGFGGTLVIAEAEDRADVSRLPRLIAEGRIQRLFLPPVALHQLAEAAGRAEGGEDLSTLQEIYVSGERLKVTPQLKRFFRQIDCLLDNQYGPTETHVCTGVILAQPATQWPALPPLGGPVANTRLYVLSATGELLPRGVPGELWIGGETQSLGYVKATLEDAARFADDPFQPGARAYRSGDLVRWGGAGLLEYLARIDRQVKLRGYRIELGEIEAAMLATPGVAEAVAVTRADAAGETRLLLYYRTRTSVTPVALRAALEARLPAHMVPPTGAIMEIAHLPLTATGKVHTAALPDPEARRPDLSSGFTASQSALEEQVAADWEAELGIAGIGRDDDFLELGGDSFKAIRLVARVNERFDIRVPLRVLLSGGTVARHAEAVAKLRGDVPDEGLLEHLEEVELAPGVAIRAPQRQEALYLKRDIDAGSYEQHGVALPRAGWVVDVGAHIGLFAMRALDASPEVRVLAIEPMPALAEALRANLACYGPRVAHEAAAAWSDAGTRDATYYPSLSGMSSLLERGQEDRALLCQILRNLAAMDGETLNEAAVADLVAERSAGARAVPVPTQRLDAILAAHRIDAVALLKVDVQGGEEAVLAGLDADAWTKVQAVAVEVQDLAGAAGRIRALLTAHGFRVAETQAAFHAGAPVRYLHGVR